MIMNNLAIIPARSGSKGLKDKNIKELCGKPLMAYSIEAAIKSGCFDEVMVSTDSQDYAEIAQLYGASVPFLRSAFTASDTASSWEMVDEVLDKYKEIGKSFDSFCLLQPTSPLRTADDIKAAYSIYLNNASFAVISVCEAEHSPLWCGHLSNDNGMNGFISIENIKQRQACEKFYRLNGALYIVDVSKYCENKFLYREGSFAYIMSQERSIDIDSQVDFELARLIMNKQTGVLL